VGGKSIPVPVGSSLADFSTGFAHIAGPSAVLKKIWAAVPGSILNTSSGIYHFRAQSASCVGAIIYSNFDIVACSPPVKITVSFGGKAWPIGAAEIIVPVASGSVECQGAIGESDDWTFGHGFLVRVCFFSLLCTFFLISPTLRKMSTLYSAQYPPRLGSPNCLHLRAAPVRFI
jgi:hypothetical protein